MSDTARWHTQTILGGGDLPPEERGDCVRACITSILGLPIDAVENTHGEGWWDRLRVQVGFHGYDLAIIDMQWDPPMEAYWIATLPSLNLGPDPDGKPADHCVVARGYTLIHDPSLGERYDNAAWAQAWNDEKVTEGWVLVPLDPAALSVPPVPDERDAMHEFASRPWTKRSEQILASYVLELLSGGPVAPLADSEREPEEDRLLALLDRETHKLYDEIERLRAALRDRDAELERLRGEVAKFLSRQYPAGTDHEADEDADRLRVAALGGGSV